MEEGKFNRLSLSKRADLVWEKGTFVDSVMYDNYCVMLYSVSRQFVELFIELKTPSIVCVSLANECDLAKYLHNFQIEM